MIDPSLLGDLAKEHKKNVLTRDEAKAFLKDMMLVCQKHGVFLRTTDQELKFSKAFEGSGMRTVLKAVIDPGDTCSGARIDYK